MRIQSNELSISDPCGHGGVWSATLAAAETCGSILRLSVCDRVVATATLPFGAPQQFRLRSVKSGIVLSLAANAGQHWSLRLLPVHPMPGTSRLEGPDANHSSSAGPFEPQPLQAGGVILLERTRGLRSSWTMDFVGDLIHTHCQTAPITESATTARFRLGAFTQHGQLFDLKDWFLLQAGDWCNGLLALRPGTWRSPHLNVLRISGHATGVQVEFPTETQSVITRSLLLVHAPAAEATAPRKLGIAYFEDNAGHAAWPAQQITRFGFARRERLEAYQQTAAKLHSPSQHFAFGAMEALRNAFERVQRTPALAGDSPLWRCEYSTARDAALKTLQTYREALVDAGYLHPLGNPVACRALAPAAAVLHILDALGQLDSAALRQAVDLVSTLAELLMRRDFYPWHVATIPDDQPGSVQEIYRGMLNQNFNTDRYTFVGLAGCLLEGHPHASLWRRHALRQFDEQMRAFVYPGGAWEESHTYANHVKTCLSPLALALRHAPERVDLFNDERFAAMCRFFVPLLSPPDPLLGGRRNIPAIGDHGYAHADYSYLMAWLACLRPQERNAYLWAWRQTGASLTKADSPQVAVFSPLLVDPQAASGQTIDLPELLDRPGFGAAARSHPHTPDESLLIVRCGLAWGHYHPDQGSFWWYCRRRLLCADSDLGEGDLKYRHCGHNVLGYLDREPMQILDRDPYVVDHCARDAEGAMVIRCQIPVAKWRIGAQSCDPIAQDSRPNLTRTFRWFAPDHLEILDQPTLSPAGRVVWHLHVLAETATRQSLCDVVFRGDDGTELHVHLPLAPISMQVRRSGRTLHLSCVYEEQPLKHVLVHHAK